MIFVAEDFIAMEHSPWQLVLFPRSNGVAILARYCNTMFGGNIVYLPQGVLWQQLLMQRCYWLQYLLLRPYRVWHFPFVLVVKVKVLQHIKIESQ